MEGEDGEGIEVTKGKKRGRRNETIKDMKGMRIITEKREKTLRATGKNLNESH